MSSGQPTSPRSAAIASGLAHRVLDVAEALLRSALDLLGLAFEFLPLLPVSLPTPSLIWPLALLTAPLVCWSAIAVFLLLVQPA